MPTFPTCRRRLPAPLEARGATVGGLVGVPVGGGLAFSGCLSPQARFQVQLPFARRPFWARDYGNANGNGNEHCMHVICTPTSKRQGGRTHTHTHTHIEGRKIRGLKSHGADCIPAGQRKTIYQC